ncbi:general substrate transporter [Xylariaceae sp. FL0255]|nr:general substrate transporter [Xylariaceae sp. FL0255]
MASAQCSFKDLLTIRRTKNFQRIVLAYGIQVIQQVTGINLTTYYAAMIYQNNIELSDFTFRILAAANGTEYLLASIPPIFLIEKFGRRLCSLWARPEWLCPMVILAVTTSISNAQSGMTVATFLFIFNTFFAIGWVSLPRLLPSELVPVDIHAPANALSTSANWILNFLVVSQILFRDLAH